MSVYLRKLAFIRQPQHTYTQKHMYAHSCKRYRRGIDTSSKRHTRTNTSCLLSALYPDIGARLIHAVPNHLVVWWLTHSHMTMHWFLFFPPPLPSSSTGCADGAAWRNPLSRHFSFPLTDRPWRAQAFGPPTWLAARQLNKLSTCCNSLKHFQLPQSNISHRRALGCFSTSNPTPQRVLFRLSFGLSGDPPCCNEEEEFSWTKASMRGSEGKLKGTNCMVLTTGTWF